MCIGIPMRVIQITSPFNVQCLDQHDDMHQIDTRLVGEVQIGEWLLTFLDAARERLTEERALLINNALSALLMVNSETDADETSQAIDLMFADLINREPTLPAHLQASLPSSPTSTSINEDQ